MKHWKALLADDHDIVIEGLRRILQGSEFDVVGTVGDGRALLRAARDLQPDVIVADITMPLLNGIEVARQIRKQDGRVKIVFLTMHPDVTYATEALAAGGTAYVLKSSAGNELLPAMRQALNGQVYLPKSIAGPVNQALRRGSHRHEAAAGRLSRRQLEVVRLLAEGRTAKEIAQTLSISSRTVEFHKYNIMETLGIHSTAELALYAVKHGLLTGP